MDAGEKIRESGFNLLVRMNFNHRADILAELNRQYEKDSAVNTSEKLENVLEHATGTTRFYAPYRGICSFEDLPVITKSYFKDKYDDFRSNLYDDKDLIPVNTSGSYGEPTRFLLDKQKKLRQFMEVVYYSNWANYRIGMKHILNTATGKKNRFNSFIFNQANHSFIDLEGRWLEDVRTELKRGQVKIYIGFSSALEELAGYCYKSGDRPVDFNLLGIISIAEALSEPSREIAEKVFGCPVLSRYAAMEFGVLSHECPEKKNHHLNNASYYIELLSTDTDNPVAPGEAGRVVVTDLHARGMPLIRYDTGDLAILADLECSCGRKGPVFDSLEGRLVENIFDQEGRRRSGFAISYLMRDFSSVSKFQFVQKDRNRYKLMLVVKDDFSDEEIIVEKIRTVLGPDIDLSVTYTDQIPTLKSGKRPYVLNEWISYKQRQQL